MDERLEQIQRRWACDLRYRRPADPVTAELHEFVVDLLDVIEEREWDDKHVCAPDDPYGLDDCNDPDHMTQQDWDDEVRNLERQHIEEIGELAPALEELHMQAHGSGSLYLCTAEPCRGLYRLLPNARGQVRR